jgi:hypothetical protein
MEGRADRNCSSVVLEDEVVPASSLGLFGTAAEERVDVHDSAHESYGSRTGD